MNRTETTDKKDKPDVIDSILSNKRVEKALRGAHIATSVEMYMMFTLLATAAAFVFTILTGLLLNVLNVQIPFFSGIPFIVIVLIAAAVITLMVYMGFICYPSLQASGRKNKIEQELPYAITYMQALSSMVTLYEIFRSVYEAHDLYGEVSMEFGLIVRDVELFGEDILTAIENTREITPSETMKELLNDLALVYRSGGNMTEFFNSKSESYRELSRQQLESMLQFLEMMSEVYVTAFVAGPIALMIMLVAQNLSGQNTLGNIMPLMLLFLPIGAIILIVVLYILLPQDNLSITRRRIKEMEFGEEVIEETKPEEVNPEFLKKLDARKKFLKFQNTIHHPVKFFISNYAVPAALSGLLAGVVLLSWVTGVFTSVFPQMTTEVLVCVVIIAAILPFSLAYEIRKRYVTKVEKQLPVFIRDIADMRDIGMTLQGAIVTISNNKTGVLSSEVQVVAEELKYGSNLSNALIRMEERIGLVSVKRAISLLVKASAVTDYVREILTIAVADLEHYIRMKSKRLNVSFVYLAVIYLSFAIYLFCAYQLNVAFISSFSNFDITFNLDSNKADMFHLGIILAFFSGLMAGQMSSNSLLSGFKHSMIMLIMTMIVFLYLI